MKFEKKENCLEISQDKGIYAQLDNFTCMFYDCTIADVFSWLKIDIEKYYGDLYRERKMFSNMCAYQFLWNGINVQAQNLACLTMKSVVDQNDLLSEEYSPDIEDFVDVFKLTLNSIRLELTGTGLHYMRENVNKEIDIYLRNLNEKPKNMKVTRCDFAYDFINYMPDILDAIIDYAQAYCTQSGRVLTYGGRGYKCEVHTVAQKKVYLGSPQSDKMLRIYDKRLEQLDRNREVYDKPNKYNNPDSWIRFEFQCRNNVAHQLCYGSSTSPDEYIQPDLFSIFKRLMGEYTLVDPETTKQNRRPYQLWLDLWDWEDLTRLYKMQNADNRIFEPYEVKLDRSIDMVLPILIVYMDKFGIVALFKKIINYLSSLFDDDEFSNRRLARFTMRLAMLDITEHKFLCVKNGEYDLSDKIKFFFSSIIDKS